MGSNEDNLSRLQDLVKGSRILVLMILKHLALHKHVAWSVLLLYTGRNSLDIVPKELLSSDLNSPTPTAVMLVGHISIFHHFFEPLM